MQHILPLDGSTCGEHALPTALTLAKTTGAAVTFLHIVIDSLNICNMATSPKATTYA